VKGCMHVFSIGPIQFKNRVVLAPMAGVCNPAFRLIAKEFGAGLVCAEMVNDKAILSKNDRTMKMLYVDEREKPMSLQIFGGNSETLVRAAEYVDQYTNADIIDINMGGGKIRTRLNETESRDEIVEILTDYVDKVERREKEKLAAKAG